MIAWMPLTIRALANDDEARLCAELMATSEPWTVIGRPFDSCLSAIRHPEREIYVAYDGEAFRGFVSIVMKGAFVGYIASVAVTPEARGGGVGSQLVAFAEERILRESPNVFLCVSSFNPRARALYERLGYQLIGELKDYLVRGHSELLMRKTTGPILGR